MEREKKKKRQRERERENFYTANKQTTNLKAAFDTKNFILARV